MRLWPQVVGRIHNLRHKKTHTPTYTHTHPRANHPHSSYYDPSSSPTDLLIIAARRPYPSFTHTHTHMHTLMSYTISHRQPLLQRLLFSRDSRRWTNGRTQRQRKWASITRLRHLQCSLRVILCYWPSCFPDKWNLINHHRKLQKRRRAQRAPFFIQSCSLNLVNSRFPGPICGQVSLCTTEFMSLSAWFIHFPFPFFFSFSHRQKHFAED